MANGDNANVTLAMIRSGAAYLQKDTVTVSNDVKAVQKALLMYGYYPGGTPDGKYGAGTEAAVKGLQNEKGLTITGNVDQATLNKIEIWSGTLYAIPTATPSMATVRKGLDYFHVGDSGNDVYTICQLLQAKGITCSLSYSYDSSVSSAVQQFQAAVGLSADGSVGQATLAALEDTISDTGWLTGTTVNLTAGKLARAGFEKLMLRQDVVFYLNLALNTYHINTKQKVRHFLAQCMKETDYGRAFTEYGYKPGTGGSASYSPYYGAGLLHLSTANNYLAYKNYKMENKIYTPSVYATQHVAIAYPSDSAGWYWDVHRGFNNNSVINWSDTDQNICYNLTSMINGSTASYSERWNNFLNISAILL